MTPRNEQDFEQRRQQIIDGAFRVFAAQGFDKATNRDIAAAAGIGSPGLIYHYFADKEDLFRQVIEQRDPLDPLVEQIAYLMELPPREALSLFGRTRRNTKTIARRSAVSRRCLTTSVRAATMSFPDISCDEVCLWKRTCPRMMTCTISCR